MAGFAGLWLAPAALPWVWAFLIGVFCASFPLSLVMINLRARTEGGVLQLSAFAQCVGYLLAVPGPLLVGILHQYTGGWTAPIAFMARNVGITISSSARFSSCGVIAGAGE